MVIPSRYSVAVVLVVSFSVQSATPWIRNLDLVAVPFGVASVTASPMASFFELSLRLAVISVPALS